ncbi:hypothetical protein WR25_25207 [Diploscapter pachys]|uniref:Uncharacterized protein n=1 Tax=Diploscapter pachys TaxID=2018661 RepID=A0A2A2LFI5_9BILA|nr:hypothetical protein WR25_25207 [Diploscapter pachys]
MSSFLQPGCAGKPGPDAQYCPCPKREEYQAAPPSYQSAPNVQYNPTGGSYGTQNSYGSSSASFPAIRPSGGHGARPSSPYQSRPNYGGGRPSYPSQQSSAGGYRRRIARKPLVGKPIAGKPNNKGQSRQRVVGRFVKAH